MAGQRPTLPDRGRDAHTPLAPLAPWPLVAILYSLFCIRFSSLDPSTPRPLGPGGCLVSGGFPPGYGRYGAP